MADEQGVREGGASPMPRARRSGTRRAGVTESLRVRSRAGWQRWHGFDRWDLLLLVALPFATVMLVCTATPAEVLARNQPDVMGYFRDARNFLAGHAPYRDFVFEYPPLALLPISLPYALWPAGKPTFLDYEWLWALQAGLIASAAGALLAWIASRAGDRVSPVRALLAWAVLVLIEAPVVAWRFDIAAVATALGAVALLIAGRSGSGGFLLALGTLLKIFPAALAPVMLAWVLWRSGGRAALRFAATFAATAGLAVAGLVALVGVGPALGFLTYQQERMLQIESIASSVLLLGHLLLALPVSIYYGFESLQIAAPGADLFVAVQTPLLVGAVLLAGVAAFLRFRSERLAGVGPGVSSLIAYLMAATILVIATNKVFSAQYALWALPFGCLLPRRQVTVVLGVALLSVFIFPLGYTQLTNLEPQAILTLAVRNGLLLLLLAWALVRYRPLSAGPQPDEPVGPGAPVADRVPMASAGEAPLARFD